MNSRDESERGLSMGILIECTCHRKQGPKNKLCPECGADLDKLKKNRKVKYWISYRVEGKQRREYVGKSIEEARDAFGKRQVQKRENRIFEILPDSNMTFEKLAEWYLDLPKVKKLTSYGRLESAIENFNSVFGKRTVGSLKQEDLEQYQGKREDEDKRKQATIDYELSVTKTMVTKAFDNDKVGPNALKAFRKTRKLLKPGSNARDRILTIEEYLRLLNAAPAHLKPILIMAFNTGMRKMEILNLTWDQVDKKKGFIRLKADQTKEKKDKSIPINHHVQAVLDSTPQNLHHGYVFTYTKKNKPLTDNLRKSLVSACSKAGFTYGQHIEGGFRFHDIRTTVKTNMLRAGVDKTLRDVILGHSLKGMDVYYIKPTDEDLHQAMDRCRLSITRRFLSDTRRKFLRVHQKGAKNLCIQ